ncbi:unnamed protein product [Discula destructiva]
MSEESKEIKSSEVPADKKLDKGKQPAVASDEEDDIDDVADGDDGPDAEDGASAQAPGAAAASKKKKKKSKRKKIKDTLTGQSQSDDPTDKIKALLDKLPENELEELVKRNPELVKDHGSDPSKAAEAFKSLSLNDVLTGLALSGKNAKDMGNYKFWKTQPVPKFDEAFDKPIEEGPLENKTVDEVAKEPQKLIDGFEWVTMDLTDDGEMKEVYQLLNGHYVEDDEAMFRFNYGTAILRWSLMAPGWKADWHVGIRDCRVKDRKPLVAFISAVPMTVRVRNKNFVASEVNFLCVHKKLRGKRLAPILIKEITRRSNLHGIWQGVYTGGIVLPKPVSTCRYYHRSLDWKKLNEVGFSPLPANSKPEWQIRKYALPEKTSTPGLREMQKKDVPAVHKLMTRYGARFDLGVEWNEEETAHWLLQPRSEGAEQAVWTYVVEDEHKNITDFFSFYNLESTIINHPQHKLMKVAYLFYYASESGLTTPPDKAALKERLNKLVNDALVLAKRFKFDVFNALSLMDNTLFLEQQKFGPGDGSLHYYLFNYRANPIAGGVNRKNQADEENGSGVGLVMM